MEIPENITAILMCLVLDAVTGMIAGIVIIKNRRKMLHEVWIPVLALCCLLVVGCSAVALCLAAAFAIAD